MRHARLLLPILLALTAAACARQQPAYYVTDSMTGQRVAAAQQGAPERERGLFTSGAPQTSAAGSYAYAQPQAQTSTSRGLFTSSSSSAPVYAYQAPAPQPYSYPPPQQAQQAYAQQAPVYQPQLAGYDTERYRWY